MAVKNVWTRGFVTAISQRTIVFANFLLTGLLGLVYIGFTGLPELKEGFYWSVITVSLVDAVAVTLLIRAIHSSDLSDAYPLVALAPVFSLGTGYLILGEEPTLQGAVGVVVIVIGAYLLRARRSQKSLFEPFRLLVTDRGAQYMMLTAGMFSILGPLFKTAMQASSPVVALTSSQWLSALWLLGILAVRGKLGGVVRELTRNGPVLSGIAVANFLQAIFNFLAFELAFVAYVSSVKRLGILFTVLLGYLFFREKGALRGAIAGAVMLVGVILIAFG